VILEKLPYQRERIPFKAVGVPDGKGTLRKEWTRRRRSRDK